LIVVEELWALELFPALKILVLRIQEVRVSPVPVVLFESPIPHLLVVIMNRIVVVDLVDGITNELKVRVCPIPCTLPRIPMREQKPERVD
jgi:hypothetical protein